MPRAESIDRHEADVLSGRVYEVVTPRLRLRLAAGSHCWTTLAFGYSSAPSAWDWTSSETAVIVPRRAPVSSQARPAHNKTVVWTLVPRPAHLPVPGAERRTRRAGGQASSSPGADSSAALGWLKQGPEAQAPVYERLR